MAVKAKPSAIELPYDGGFTVYIDKEGNMVCGIPPWSGPYPYNPVTPSDRWSGPEPYPFTKIPVHHDPMPTPIAPIIDAGAIQLPVDPHQSVPGPAPVPVDPVGIQLPADGGFTVYIDENGNAVCGTPPAGYGGGASEEAEPEIVCYIPPGTVHEYPGEFVPTVSNPDSPVPPFHPVLGQTDTIATTEPVTPVDGDEEIEGGIICYIPPGAHDDMPYYDPTVKYDVTIKQAFDPAHPPVSSPLDDPFTLSMGPDGTIVCGDVQPDPVQAALDHFIYGNTGPKAPDVYELTSGSETAHSAPTVFSVDAGPTLTPQTADLVI